MTEAQSLSLIMVLLHTISEEAGALNGAHSRMPELFPKDSGDARWQRVWGTLRSRVSPEEWETIRNLASKEMAPIYTMEGEPRALELK
jgi:hypothetical protein